MLSRVQRTQGLLVLGLPMLGLPILGIGFVAALVSAAAADTIHLRNGDRIHGKVLELTEQEVKLQSEIHGIFKLPRDKVLSISIGDVPADPQPAARAPVPRGVAGGRAPAPGSVDELLDRMLPKNFDQQTVKELGNAAGAAGGIGAAEGTVDQVIEQLRTEGVPAELMSELNLMLPGFSSPGVQGYFNDRVNGLIDGSLDINDIRRDATKAADELRSLQAELGPEGAALNGYLGILEGFLQSTAPPPAAIAPKAAAPRPAAPQSAPQKPLRKAEPAVRP